MSVISGVMEVDKLYKNEGWLEKQYLVNKKTLKEIAVKCGVSIPTIVYWLDKSDIKRRTNSEVNSGKNNPNWKGGKTIWGGYRKIYKPDHPRSYRNCVYEHVLIVEKMLGRYLEPEETVHHINRIKDDNRIENLCICKDEKEHRKMDLSIIKCIPILLKEGIIGFNKEKGGYYLLGNWSI